MRRARLLPLLLLTPLLMAPPLGSCEDSCGPLIRSTQPFRAWTVSGGTRFDAGVFSATDVERAVHVELTVAQPPDAFQHYPVALRVFTSFPRIVTPDCTTTSWNLCFDSSKGRPTVLQRYNGNLDHGTCPSLARPAVDGIYFNDFAALTLVDDAGVGVDSVRGCLAQYTCRIDDHLPCWAPQLTVTRDTGGPGFHCDRDAGVCTTSFNMVLRLNEPAQPKSTWHQEDGGWSLKPTTDAERTLSVSFSAQIDGPLVPVDCDGCVRPVQPEGLTLSFALTQIR